MTHYHQEINRIRHLCYANQDQLSKVIRTRYFIRNHSGLDLKLDKLSEVGHTSKYHLLRLFKRYYGQTPGQYLAEIKLGRAKILLSEGASVTDACYGAGYETLSSFCTLFKKHFGETPRSFQKRAIFTNSGNH